VVAFASQSSTLAPASFGLTVSSRAEIYVVYRCVTPRTPELISVRRDIAQAPGPWSSQFATMKPPAGTASERGGMSAIPSASLRHAASGFGESRRRAFESMIVSPCVHGTSPQ
jgi:hypothetical protein